MAVLKVVCTDIMAVLKVVGTDISTKDLRLKMGIDWFFIMTPQITYPQYYGSEETAVEFITAGYLKYYY